MEIDVSDDDVFVEDEEWFCSEDGRIYRLLDTEPWAEEMTPWIEVTRPKPDGPACEILGVFPPILMDDPKDRDFQPTDDRVVGTRVQPWRQAKYNQ